MFQMGFLYFIFAFLKRTIINQPLFTSFVKIKISCITFLRLLKGPFVIPIANLSVNRTTLDILSPRREHSEDFYFPAVGRSRQQYSIYRKYHLEIAQNLSSFCDFFSSSLITKYTSVPQKCLLGQKQPYHTA